jgi:crotonobetainyl-CoA:carnitine CoA-transferase CaiB-like acyl-CoA transferase
MPRSRRPSRKAPLSGLRVLDASRVLAGPYLAMLLADLGAEVVKIEKPDGGDQTRAWGPPWTGRGRRRTSAYFVSANRGKSSRTLDLRTGAGRREFADLVASSDVLIENFLPSEWRKLGFRGGAAVWTRRHPRLVHCTVSGYGTRGPLAERPAYDVALQAESGLMAITGSADGEPVRGGVAIVDVLAALFGLGGTLAALVRRGRDGRGGRVEVSMIDAATAFLSYAAQSFLASGKEPPRLGSRHPNLAPYQALAARDGWIVVGVGTDAMWRRFCVALGRPALARDARFATNAARLRHREALDGLVAEAFRGHTVAHWERVLRRNRVPGAAVLGVGAALGRARRRGQIARLGGLETVASPFLLDGWRAVAELPPPALGGAGRRRLKT